MVIKFWTLLRKWQQMTIMSTTIVDVKDDTRGSIVGFGTEKDCGDDAKAQTIGLPGKYMACAFFIDREELKKYL